MKFRLTLVVFLFSFYCHHSCAQVAVLGKFEMGDTVHAHRLKTSRGDEFIGITLSWTIDSLVFLTQEGARIAFPPASVQMLETMEPPADGIMNASIFLLTAKDGTTYYGYPKFIEVDKIGFVTGSNNMKRFRPENVTSIVPTSTMSLFFKEPFINDYQYQIHKKKKAYGEFVGYENGKIQLKKPDGGYWERPINEFYKFEINPPVSPYNGYGRSLMFTQTGFAMKANDREYRNIQLGINILAVGLSDHISMGFGLITILPYADIKYANNIGKYVHYSMGGYVLVPFAGGYHGAVSIGTPDYFLNISYLRNIDVERLEAEQSFESLCFGGSFRIGNRSRFFAEYNILTAPKGKFGGYESFYELGYGNAFTWGYGFFKKRFRLETGFTEIGPFDRFSCFPSPCDEYYHAPIPFFAFSYSF